ncbi:hypothetical protein HPP92_007436 [Vanilla planifolia]|uniref:WRKY domain-containing protein n=1 Tax=Vanilla planifolia TaxID=51239 RepID=A0A835RHJ6_VANPL|nr:hypothetical protein HPP92_007436 [Vanilla planifolia]
MENTTTLMIAELTQVHGLASKLAAHLDSPHIDLCRTLARDIIFSIEKAIHTVTSITENPPAYVGSQPAEIPTELGRTNCRKMLPQYSSHVSMSSGTAQGTPNDGRTWRKYGQKSILGAKYPRLVQLLPAFNLQACSEKAFTSPKRHRQQTCRAYYRCSHRKTQGCPATKQVQRSDENPAVFDIAYRGTHTCSKQTTAAVMQSCRQENIWPQKTEGINSVLQYPSSSFSFPFAYVGSPSSSFMSSSTLGLKSHHGSAELTAAANDDTKFMDLGILFEVGERVGDVPFDASAFFI